MMTSPAPVVHWVGGKSWMADDLVAVFSVPDILTRQYVDPFCGGLGAFCAWHRAWENARLAAIGRGAPVPFMPTPILADANASLIACYRAVQRSPDAVADELDTLRAVTFADHAAFAAFHKAQRARFNAWTPQAARFTLDAPPPAYAALVIWLTKNSFNGLWRVNRKGEFNVPVGTKPGPTSTRDELRMLSYALRDAALVHCDFRETLKDVPHHAVIYLDPPYVTAVQQTTATHTSYTESVFDHMAQAELAALAAHHATQGAHVVVSNHDTPIVRGLYTGFDVAARPVRRTSIARSNRQAAQEVLLVSKRGEHER